MRAHVVNPEDSQSNNRTRVVFFDASMRLVLKGLVFVCESIPFEKQKVHRIRVTLHASIMLRDHRAEGLAEGRRNFVQKSLNPRRTPQRIRLL